MNCIWHRRTLIVHMLTLPTVCVLRESVFEVALPSQWGCSTALQTLWCSSRSTSSEFYYWGCQALHIYSWEYTTQDSVQIQQHSAVQHIYGHHYKYPNKNFAKHICRSLRILNLPHIHLDIMLKCIFPSEKSSLVVVTTLEVNFLYHLSSQVATQCFPFATHQRLASCQCYTCTSRIKPLLYVLPS